MKTTKTNLRVVNTAEVKAEAPVNPELLKHEGTIRKGQQAFIAMAKAIVAIIDGELFKPQYADKSAYFRSRWEMSSPTLARFENAGRLILALEKSEAKLLPMNEGQCRAIQQATEGDEGKALKLWNAVTETKQPVTAKVITATARKLSPKSEGQKVTKPETMVSATLTIKVDAPEGWGTSFDFDGHNIQPVENRHGEYEVIVDATTNAKLFGKLAKWDKINSVKVLSVKF